MGEAKRRGPFEVRKARAIKWNKAQSIKRAEAAEERLQAAQERARQFVGKGQPQRKRSVVTAATIAAMLASSKL